MGLLHGLGLFEESLDKVISKTQKYKCEVGLHLGLSSPLVILHLVALAEVAAAVGQWQC